MKRLVPVLTLILVVSIAIPSVAGAQSQPDCNSLQESEICIVSVDISDRELTQGGSVTLNIELKQVGNQTGDAVIVMGTRQPSGGYTYGLLKKVGNVESGSTKTLKLTLPVESKGKPGVHALNFMVFDESQTHMYDSTGYTNTIVIEEDSLNLLRWFNGLGSVTKSVFYTLSILSLLYGGKRWRD